MRVNCGCIWGSLGAPVGSLWAPGGTTLTFVSPRGFLELPVFVAPLMVIIAWVLGLPLTFEFGLLETVAAFLAVLIANAIASDGKSNWLEGAMLLGTYAVLALAFWFHP